jgi:Tfp pilus assembly PilM family ATPase
MNGMATDSRKVETSRPASRGHASPRGAVARRFVAVDFDSRGLRLAQARRAGARVRVERVLFLPAPPGLDMDDARAVGATLKTAMRENRLAGWPIVMCVPRERAALKTLAFPPGTGEAELAAMVQYQVEKELPFRAEEAVVDFTALGRPRPAGAPAGTEAARVVVAAVRVPVVDFYRHLAQAAGAKLLSLGLRPYANLQCFAACLPAQADERAALVNLTADETEIDVFDGADLAFSRSAIARPPTGERAPEAESAEAIDGIVAEVVRSLQSYQSAEGGGKVERIYIAGGTGLEEGLARSLARRTGAACQKFQPARAMQLGGQGAGDASEFVTALGLAVGGGATALDFLSPKRPAAVRNTARTTAILAAAALAVLALSASLLAGRYLSAKRARVQTLEGELRKIESRRARALAEANRLDFIEAWQDGPEWLDHLALLSAKFLSAKDAVAGRIDGSGDGTLRFTLHAASEEVVTRITRQLNEAGYVATAGRQDKTNDPRYLQYPHSSDLTVRCGPNMEVDLDSLKAVPRPEDDLGAGESQPRPSPPADASRPAAGPPVAAASAPSGGAAPAAGGNLPPGAGATGAGTGAAGAGAPPAGRDPNRPRRFGGYGRGGEGERGGGGR